RSVVIAEGIHGANHCYIINTLAGLAEYFGYFNSRLAVPLERKWTLQKRPRIREERLNVQTRRGSFQVMFLQRRLGIKGVYVARATSHEKRDDGLGLGLKMRLLG